MLRHKARDSTALLKVSELVSIMALALRALNACLQREYAFEVEEYKIQKKIANLICDMGFVISDNVPSSGLTKYHRLVK